jgi:hypothetical protein
MVPLWTPMVKGLEFKHYILKIVIESVPGKNTKEPFCHVENGLDALLL